MGNESDNLQHWAAATTISVTVLAFVSVCLRLLSRWERKQKLWWDDWMIIWSMVRSFNSSPPIHQSITEKNDRPGTSS